MRAYASRAPARCAGCASRVGTVGEHHVYTRHAVDVRGGCLDHLRGSDRPVLPSRPGRLRRCAYLSDPCVCGYSLFFVMLIVLLVAFAARLPWRIIGLTAVLPALVFLQSIVIQV